MRAAVVLMVMLTGVLLAGCNREPVTFPQMQARVRAQPASVPARLALADACVARDMLHDAHVQYQRALELDNQSYEAAIGLARVRLALGDNAKAIGAAKRALALKPDSAEAVALQGEIYLAMEELAKAAERFEKAARLDPGNVLVWENLPLVYARADRLSEAKDAAQRALKALPENVNVHMNLAAVLGIAGDTRAAEKRLRIARDLDQKNPEPPMRIAEILITENRSLQEAYDLAQESAEIDAGTGQAYALAAIALHKMGETNRAVLELKRNVQIHHQNLRLWLLLATLAQRNGDQETARLAAGMAIRIGPRPQDTMKEGEPPDPEITAEPY